MTIWRVKGLRSPDLNPIENLCDAPVRAISSRFPPTATLIELETALQEEWRLLNSAVVDHLIESTYPINVLFSIYAVYFHFIHNSV
ncbi:transposable element Tcb1 transposase [Trichonephila clavipes]|uniref:Transposable element Tcb1 transposase n=1 Tax=Trichonephila clavipes TaxID=2585209 RepID=A0A8X6RG85_TRICX|nr:transposable element Tcb1 transposase [Trichonephila clavipes]